MVIRLHRSSIAPCTSSRPAAPCTSVKPNRCLPALRASTSSGESSHTLGLFGGVALAAATLLAGAQMSYAATGVPERSKLPPVPSDPNRCATYARDLIGETVGKKLNKPQAQNAVDLRLCDFHDSDLRGKALAGSYLVDTNLKGADLREAVLTKAFANNANLESANMTNAVVNGVDFGGANLKGASLANAVITGANFNGADLTGVNFEDALVSQQDQKRLCTNESLVGDSRDQIGCPS